MPRVTGDAECRSCARASWATYSRIMIPELPAGPAARKGAQAGQVGLHEVAEAGGRELGDVVQRAARAWSSASARYAVENWPWW